MKIETNVPIPSTTARTVYPWAEMSHGQSLFFEADATTVAAVRNRITTAASRWLKNNRPNWTHVVRTIHDEVTKEVIGIRLWLRDLSIKD